MFITTLSIALGLLNPNHPKDIVYQEYVFTPPQVEAYRETLPCGVTVFIVEDKELPLINVGMTFRGGKYLDDSETTGATEMMAALIRNGGTASITAEELDEKLAYLATTVSVRSLDTTVSAGMNSLSSNFEESFTLFLDMLQNPRFQDSRVRLEKDDIIEDMKQRNDFPSGILRREFNILLFGDSYFGQLPVESSIEVITNHDLREMHSIIIAPSNLILSISGDFDKNEMLDFLEASISNWNNGTANGDPPDNSATIVPGVYYINQDVPQGGVRIGIRTLRQDDPDIEAAIVMNYILGGGGFSSRITQSVRSNEGLAYGAGSSFSPGIWSDGMWGAGFESKSSTVALATKLIFDEIDKMNTELVSDEDLAVAKNALTEQFPSKFQSKSGILAVFTNDEITKRDSAYWQTYRDKISKVTAEDVKRVANRILVPQEMIVLVVGNWVEIEKGDLGGRASMTDIKNIVGGDYVELPLRNPMTLELPMQ